MRDPLIFPLIGVAAGVLLNHWLDTSHNGFLTHEVLWPCVLLALFAVIARSVWLRRLCTGLALLFAGVACDAWHRPGPPPVIDASAKELVALEGCVVEPSAESDGREQFTLELASNARARVTLPLRENENPQRLRYGQRVEIVARVRRPRNFRNPGAFDYEAYLARQYIYWNATMPAKTRAKTRATVLKEECGTRLRKAVFALREVALDRITNLYSKTGDDSRYETGMMRAILIGDTAQLERIWTEDFRRTGTFHALVISGTHVIVLTGVLLFLLRLCRLPEMAALATTSAAAWLYALVSGFSPPVARAAAGFTLYLLARFFFRRGRVLNLLAAIALVFLLTDPVSLFDASFQLSFLSVAAIGAIAAPVIEGSWGPLVSGLRGLADPAGASNIDPHLEPRVAQFRVELRLIAEALHYTIHLPVTWCAHAVAGILRLFFFTLELGWISLAIQVGLALPMAEYFHRISLTGLSANLIIVPLLDLVVPLGFAAVFTQWHWVASLAGWLLQLAAATAKWHVHLEPSWRVANPPLWLAAGAILSLFALAISLRFKHWRWAMGVLATVFFSLLLLQPANSKLWPVQIRPQELELTSIDVGQGDSLFVAFPEGKRMVVDAGGFLQFGDRRGQRKPGIDTGEDVVSPYLWSRGIRRLDVLVVTHAHEDHMGGALALLENFRPQELWVGANPNRSLLDRAEALGVNVLELRETDPFDYSGARIEILSPPEDYTSDKPAATPSNNDSLALRLAYGTNSFLLTGDMESPMEYRLLSEGRLRHTDVLKVGHHGSKTSTTDLFLEAISPSIALISAGFENSFGHPHPSVLARLQARNITVLRTDLGGLATVHSDGSHLKYEIAQWAGEESAQGTTFSWSTTIRGEEQPP